MDQCDTAKWPPKWNQWIRIICDDLESSGGGGKYAERLKNLNRYKIVVEAISRVEAREVAELLNGRAA